MLKEGTISKLGCLGNKKGKVECDVIKSKRRMLQRAIVTYHSQNKLSLSHVIQDLGSELDNMEVTEDINKSHLGQVIVTRDQLK